MAPPRFQAHAVELIYQNTELLYQRFEQAQGDEGKRRWLQDGNEAYAPDIVKWLGVFSDGKTLKAPFAVPRNAFNQFLATWSQGKGDIKASSRLLTEYRTLLLNARPEVDRIVNRTGDGDDQPPPPPPVTTGATKQDLQALQTVVENTQTAAERFERCLVSKDLMAAKAIKASVAEIDSELKRDWSTAALADLRVPIATWGTFVRLYNAGRGLDRRAFEPLEEFQAQIVNANRQLAGSHA